MDANCCLQSIPRHFRCAHLIRENSMNRLVLGISLVAFIGVALVAQAAGEDAKQQTAKAPLAKRKSSEIIDMLRQPVDARGLRERVKFKDALEYLNSQFGNKLPFVVNREAFGAE